MSIISVEEWNEFIKQYPDASLYQSSAWGELKEQFGWEKPLYVCTGRAGAQVLIRRLPMGIGFAYIPKGPLGTHWQDLWKEIDDLCLKKKLAFLKVEPDVIEPVTDNFHLEMEGFNKSTEYIQPFNTMYFDLNGNENDWFARISSTSRRYIRRSIERGVVVHQSDDVECLYNLIKISSDRHRFSFRSLDYYKKAFEIFDINDQGNLFIVECNGEPLAAYLLFNSGSKATYLYGGSVEDKNKCYPNYLGYWEMIKWSAAQGCKNLDLLGIANEKRLEDVADPINNMGGLYKFKRQFGARLVRSVGPWDRVYDSFHYRLYSQLKNAMAIMENPIIENILRKAILVIKKT